MELKRDEIIKALECCSNKPKADCDNCPMIEKRGCAVELYSKALALINSQEQRIKELSEDLHATRTELTRVQEENERWRAELKGANKDKHILLDEIALLEAEAEKAIDIAEGNIRAEIASGGTSCHWCEDKIKADTVRKIADLLWQGESEKLNISMGGKYYGKQEFIDQIPKEMLEVAQRPEVLNDQFSGLSDPEGDRAEVRKNER